MRATEGDLTSRNGSIDIPWSPPSANWNTWTASRIERGYFATVHALIAYKNNSSSYSTILDFAGGNQLRFMATAGASFTIGFPSESSGRAQISAHLCLQECSDGRAIRSFRGCCSWQHWLIIINIYLLIILYIKYPIIFSGSGKTTQVRYTKAIKLMVHDW